MEKEITIPEGLEATIEGSKIIFKKIESKDEKIRKTLIDFFQDWRKNRSHCWGIAVTDILSWLEKQGEQKLPIEKLPEEMKTIGESLGFTTQKECDEYNQMVSELIMSEGKGEQKPEDKIKPKFKVGDWVVVSTTKGDRVVQIASVEYFKDGSPSYTTTEGRWFGNETKARLLTDKDVETITLPESKFITYKDKEKQGEQKPTDNDMVEALRTEYEKGRADAIAKMQELTLDEEDKEMIDIVVSYLERLGRPLGISYIPWLKSLKQRIGGKL